jgi:virginiamycin B lyase
VTSTRRTWKAAIVVALAAALAALVAGTANAQKAAPGNALADGITLGPDGNVWFTQFNAFKIGRVTPAGKIRQFGTTTRGAADITTGPDGALWFTEYGERLGRITTTGQLSEIPVPFGNYRGIAAGPDGRLWLADKDGDKLVAVTPQGAATEYPLIKGSTPEEIVVGPDGNLWVTLFARHGVARVTPAGAVTEFLFPSAAGNPYGIVVGPDGALWVSLAQYPGVVRVTTDGAVAEVPLPGVGPGGARGITVGSDGALWLAYDAANRIGRLTLVGGYTEVALSTRGAKPLKIVGAPSGVWFTENGRDRIGRVTPAATPTGFGPIQEFAYDATPPKAKVTVTAAARASARAGLRAGGRLRLPTRVRCNEACSVQAELWASKALAAKLGVSGSGPLVRLGTTRRGFSRNRVVPVSLSRAISRKLAARPGSALTLRVFARDRSANAIRVQRKVTI